MRPEGSLVFRGVFVWAVVLVPLWAEVLPAQAAGRVELILIGEGPAAADFHEWLRVLSQAGATSVRIRSGQPLDKVGIEVQGTPERPVYVVTGTLTSRGELVLPGGRFQRSDASRLAQWLADLAQNGPPDRREPKSAFGLTAKQFQQVHDDLAQLVGFTTQRMTRGEVVQKIAHRLQFSVRMDPGLLKGSDEDRVAEELSGLSCGTALACVVRPLGMCMVPQQAGRDLVYVINPAKPGEQTWPIGWTPEKPAREVLPALYEFLTVNIQGVSAAEVMEAIGKRLKVPIVVDHNALARHGIQPEKVLVSLPSGRSTHSLVLQKVLFQARLKSELRVDEAGNAFLWVTSIKPL